MATRTTTSAPPNLSVRSLEEAVTIIFRNNFDADSKTCLITLMKVLDNVLQKPGNPKVRSIRIANPAFSAKVASRKGGIEFLQACGFVLERPPPPLLSAAATTATDPCLVLHDEEHTDVYHAHIVTARRLLMTRAIQDLGLHAEDLPTYKQPPKLSTTPFTSSTKNAPSFDPYQTQRYDAMSAAVGSQLTPDANYVSKTEQQLLALQSKKEKLERKMIPQDMDRQWTTFHNPNQATTAVAATREDTKSSNKLLAAQYAKQQAQRRQREEGGFVTKSMREVERLKRQKVYSHAQLAFTLPDGKVLSGRFLPQEKISTVMKALQEDCFQPTTTPFIQHLYITPPRTILSPSKTLLEEDLVPAAKIFVKFMDNHPPLKPQFAIMPTTPSSFPSSQPIVQQPSQPVEKKDTTTTTSEPTDSKTKEDALMARMMGGMKRLGSGRKKSDSKSNKPKWFK